MDMTSINSDGSMTSELFTTIASSSSLNAPSNMSLMSVTAASRGSGRSRLALNGVELDSTTITGLTLALLEERPDGTGYELLSRMRYNTETNPHAGVASNGGSSIYTMLRNLPANRIFVIYSHNLNTIPTSYDLDRLPNPTDAQSYGVPIDIHYMFKAMGARLWDKLQRVANNGRETTPYCCIGIGGSHDTTSNDPYRMNAQIIYENIGTATGSGVGRSIINISATLPNRFSKVNLVGNYTLTPTNTLTNPNRKEYIIPCERSPATGNQIIDSKVSVLLQMNATFINPTNATYIPSEQTVPMLDSTVQFVSASGTAIPSHLISRTVSRTPFGYTTIGYTIPYGVRNQYGDIKVTITEDFIGSHLKFAHEHVQYSRYLNILESNRITMGYGAVNSATNRQMVVANEFVASNIGGRSMNYFNGVESVNTSPLYPVNLTNARMFDDLTNLTVLNSGQSVVATIPIGTYANYVFHMFCSAGAATVNISARDEFNNIVPLSTTKAGTTSNFTSFTYPTTQDTIGGITGYSHKFINIPIYSNILGDIFDHNLYYDSQAERVPTAGKRPVFRRGNASSLIISVTANSNNFAFHAKLLNMIVGFNSTGTVFATIDNAY